MAQEQDIEAIVGPCYASLYRFALSLTRNEVEACDLTQQTFFRLARRSRQIRDTKKIRWWLYTTLRRDVLQIVIAENGIPATHFDEHAREQDGWRIKYERRNALLVIFFRRAPMNVIIQFT